MACRVLRCRRGRSSALERTRPSPGPTHEAGVRKTNLARWIHTHSSRQRGPLVTLRCASSEHGLEKAMFGSGRTVKRDGYPGAFEAATGGTVLLEDVDALGLECQGRLRRM